MNEQNAIDLGIILKSIFSTIYDKEPPFKLPQKGEPINDWLQSVAIDFVAQAVCKFCGEHIGKTAYITPQGNRACLYCFEKLELK